MLSLVVFHHVPTLILIVLKFEVLQQLHLELNCLIISTFLSSHRTSFLYFYYLFSYSLFFVSLNYFIHFINPPFYIKLKALLIKLEVLTFFHTKKGYNTSNFIFQYIISHIIISFLV